VLIVTKATKEERCQALKEYDPMHYKYTDCEENKMETTASEIMKATASSNDISVKTIEKLVFAKVKVHVEKQANILDESGIDEEYLTSIGADQFDMDQVIIGVEVEMEHTDDPKVALQIAIDHLNEFPDYYTGLKNMEKELHNKGE